MKKILTTLALLTVIATPAFAQYAAQDYQGAMRPIVHHKRFVGQNGLNAFATVQRRPEASTSLDDPSFTGGGSVGYNQLIRSY